MGVQRGMDRSNDWLWRPLKSGAGRGVGGGQCGTWRWSGGGRERRHDPREPARTGAAEEPEEAERLGQGQAAGRRALGCRPQAEVSAGPALPASPAPLLAPAPRRCRPRRQPRRALRRDSEIMQQKQKKADEKKEGNK
ncbi:small EDRK-rich factor 2 isoform X1 [Cinclus cinclus]|uniref:small EDRK-rich factor 2 isoform X1 n=1 Tax=Cinclus cinclus TaxID=127875 RepID=UPI002E111AD8